MAKVFEQRFTFLFLILIFFVSQVNYYIFMSPSIPKMIKDVVYLISSA